MSKWKALAGALVVMAYAVLATARRLPSTVQLLLEDFAVLLVGSAGSVVAGWVAARRGHAQARAVRSQLGLPVERGLWSPWVLVGLWSAAVIPFMMAEVLIVSRYIGAHSEPEADGSWAQADAVAWLMVLTVVAFVVGGGLHGLVQQRRRTREQQHVRSADQQFLTASSDE
ncbi:hypothetical protein AB0465_40555 [Streptomyces griseoviridis]|uniref:hypothetical protein n=1 Tax=Streptomyces griseoviridis TaxID=45398 RepID=UPI00344FF3A1